MSEETNEDILMNQMMKIREMLDARQFSNHEAQAMKDAMVALIDTFAGKELPVISIGGAHLTLRPGLSGHNAVIGGHYQQRGREIAPGVIVFDPNEQKNPVYDESIGSPIHGYASSNGGHFEAEGVSISPAPIGPQALIDVEAGVAASPQNPRGIVPRPGSLMQAAQVGGDGVGAKIPAPSDTRVEISKP